MGAAAVKFIPTGGLYVTGGLTPKNIRFIEGQNSPFLQAYHDKGRVKPVLENVPLFAVLVEDLGVRGALKSAQIEYQKYSGGGARLDKKKKATDMVIMAHMVAGAVAGFVLGMALYKRK